MSEIGYHDYSAVPLQVKYGWIRDAAGGAAVEASTIGLGNLGNDFADSDASLRSMLEPLGVGWQGAGADATAAVLHAVAQRGGGVGAASGVGGGTVDAYGSSFESLRPRVHWEDPGDWNWFEMGVDVADSVADTTPIGDVFDIQSDHMSRVEQNRTLDAEATRALEAHEQLSREALGAFPTVEAASVVTPAGGAGAWPSGFGGVGGVGSGGFGSPTGAYGGPEFTATTPTAAGSTGGGSSAFGTPAAYGPTGGGGPAGVVPTRAPDGSGGFGGLGGPASGGGSSAVGGSGVAGGGIPGRGIAGSGIPGSGIPGSGGPGSGAPGSGIPGSGGPGSGGPGSGGPGSGFGGPGSGFGGPGAGATGFGGTGGNGRPASLPLRTGGSGVPFGAGGSATPVGLPRRAVNDLGGWGAGSSGGGGSSGWRPTTGSGGPSGNRPISWGTSSGGEFAGRLPGHGSDGATGGRNPGGSPAPGTTGRAGGGPGGIGHTPFLGAPAGASGSGGTEHRRKYWIPTDEAFDVPLPPHTEPVLEGRDER